MTSKSEILKFIRAQTVPQVELPNLDQKWIRYADPLDQFTNMVAAVGGRCVRVQRMEEIAAHLQNIPEFATASQVYSNVSGISSTISFESIEDPHQLETVDWAILSAQLGVAENGALWVTDENLLHRAIYFIVQHLALVLPVDQLVHNLHEAYEKISVETSSLGVFISGPSKTADIEQSLVIGAHGPRSLTVFCVG